MERQSSLVAYWASGLTTLFGGITLQEVAIVVGILTAIGTFVINWYYKAKEDSRAEKRRNGSEY